MLESVANLHCQNLYFSFSGLEGRTAYEVRSLIRMKNARGEIYCQVQRLRDASAVRLHLCRVRCRVLPQY